MSPAFVAAELAGAALGPGISLPARPFSTPLDEYNDMSDTHVTIYHNPACGTSRNTLALIRNAGIEPASSST